MGCKSDTCPCSYTDEQGNKCANHGKCCECLSHHRENQELPACYFTTEQEAIYDRSIKHYWKANNLCTCGGNHAEK